MSYHNRDREWDRGKDYWQQDEYSSWNDGPRGNTRGRDDDYYTEGKRRKYNNGGYDGQKAYDDYGSGYSKRNDQGQGGGEGYNKKRLVPSEASPHVIFLGLDPDFTESDLQAYLASNNCSIESVTIIRDRSTGASKGFGFAQFTSTEHAKAFVDPLFPFIQIPPPASHGASATAAFYKALETGAQHSGRRVKIDYSQSATPHDKGRGGRFQSSNDGTRDIGNSQSPVLLFRGLDPLSGPQAIAQAMKTSSGTGKEGAKGMKRIILIKDKVTLGSWGFAFVEFVDQQSASATLAATMAPQIHPNGFRISDRPVAASFAHPYSFQPIPDYSLKDDSCIPSSMALGGLEGAHVKYWDEGSMIAVIEFEVEQSTKSGQEQGNKEKKEKKKKATAQDVPKEATILPLSDKPVTLSFNKGGLPANKPALTVSSASKVAPVSLGFSLAEEGDGQDDSDTNAGDSKVVVPKKVAPLIASKKTTSNINKWNYVQEINQDQPLAVLSSDSTVKIQPIEQPKASQSEELPPETEFEFSNTATMACLLCARQFKSLEQLKRHNNESDLHKKNYKDANLRDIAKEKVKTTRLKSSGAGGKSEQKPDDQTPKYRDRASERRVMHNQPDAPMPSSSSSGGVSGNGRRSAPGPPKPPSPPPPPPNPGQDESNVGNKLLKMMGWTEGTGLGTNREGRVDPIQTAIYTQGVGLGASKGKDIESLSNGGYSSYNNTHEVARERYNDAS